MPEELRFIGLNIMLIFYTDGDTVAYINASSTNTLLPIILPVRILPL